MTAWGQEAKKELSQLGSLKLDMPDGNARFKDGLSRIEKNVQRLTTFFSRCGALFFFGCCWAPHATLKSTCFWNWVTHVQAAGDWRWGRIQQHSCEVGWGCQGLTSLCEFWSFPFDLTLVLCWLVPDWGGRVAHDTCRAWSRAEGVQKASLPCLDFLWVSICHNFTLARGYKAVWDDRFFSIICGSALDVLDKS